MDVKKLWHPTGVVDGTIALDGSKSFSNRVLIIRALSGEHFDIHHLSTSDDTCKMKDLLESEGLDEYNVHHAGTTFRFLTAYLALKEGRQILTGSSRMLERPIGPLVEALRAIGCDIKYLGKEGYPPLEIGTLNKSQYKAEVSIDAGISSQYITALILIAPCLPHGLTIKLKGDLVSESYLQLTLGIVRDFGIEVTFDGKEISIENQQYTIRPYTIEADWSAASYYYSVIALAQKGKVKLKGLFEQSLQGDAALVDIGHHLGVKSEWKNDHWELSKQESASQFKHNFINQPDIAQTLGVICASANISNEFNGLKTLRIKETDRIDAMNRELEKIGSGFVFSHMNDEEDEVYKVLPGLTFKGSPKFETYKDHRMAMAFAPLALLHSIEIEKPMVVTKSYPAFYRDLESLGFIIEDQ